MAKKIRVMAKSGKVFEGEAIRNPSEKEYTNPQEAANFYHKERIRILGSSFFPSTDEDVLNVWNKFEYWLKKLIKFQNPVNLEIWHEGEATKEDGEVATSTWINFCTFERKFLLSEMFPAIEILRRATPNEIGVVLSGESLDNKDERIVEYFNTFAYPELKSISNFLKSILDQCENQLLTPIKNKINSDLKIMCNIPINENVDFLKNVK